MASPTAGFAAAAGGMQTPRASGLPMSPLTTATAALPSPTSASKRRRTSCHSTGRFSESSKRPKLPFVFAPFVSAAALLAADAAAAPPAHKRQHLRFKDAAEASPMSTQDSFACQTRQELSEDLEDRVGMEALAEIEQCIEAIADFEASEKRKSLGAAEPSPPPPARPPPDPGVRSLPAAAARAAPLRFRPEDASPMSSQDSKDAEDFESMADDEDGIQALADYEGGEKRKSLGEAPEKEVEKRLGASCGPAGAASRARFAAVRETLAAGMPGEAAAAYLQSTSRTTADEAADDAGWLALSDAPDEEEGDEEASDSGSGSEASDEEGAGPLSADVAAQLSHLRALQRASMLPWAGAGGEEDAGAYAEGRLEKIARNNAFLFSLGLGAEPAKMRSDLEAAQKQARLTCHRLKIQAAPRLFEKPYWAMGHDALADALQKLETAWPARCGPLRRLVGVLSAAGGGSRCGGAAPSVFAVVGPPATGKSGIVRALLETGAQGHFAWVNCCWLPKAHAPNATAALFERALDALKKNVRHGLAAAVARVAASSPRADAPRPPRKAAKEPCRDASTFAHRLDEIALESFPDDGDAWVGGVGEDAAERAARVQSLRTFVVVLDGCERIVAGDKPGGAIHALLYAARLTRFCTVVVFEIGDDRCLATKDAALGEPIRLHFEAYTAAEMAMVLKAHAPGFDADPAVYGAFVDAIASVSRKFTRDVRQLRRLTTSPELFAVYSAEPTPAERFAAIMPALRATAPKLHDMNLDVPKAIADAALPSGGSARLERLRACRTLSGQAALVLLAAFIASHTTKERDEVLFTNKASKRRQAAAPQSQKIAMPRGPQPVQMDRLLSVYKHLAASRPRPPAAPRRRQSRGPRAVASFAVAEDSQARQQRDPRLEATLATLIARGLLERSTSLEDFTKIKFRCLLATETAHDIADAMQPRFQLARYLQ